MVAAVVVAIGFATAGGLAYTGMAKTDSIRGIAPPTAVASADAAQTVAAREPLPELAQPQAPLPAAQPTKNTAAELPAAPVTTVREGATAPVKVARVQRESHSAKPGIATPVPSPEKATELLSPASATQPAAAPDAPAAEAASASAQESAAPAAEAVAAPQ
jgi:hypothetical protein